MIYWHLKEGLPKVRKQSTNKQTIKKSFKTNKVLYFTLLTEHCYSGYGGQVCCDIGDSTAVVPRILSTDVFQSQLIWTWQHSFCAIFTPTKDESGCVRVISWQSAVNSNISPFFNCSYIWPNIDDTFCKIRRQKITSW